MRVFPRIHPFRFTLQPRSPTRHVRHAVVAHHEAARDEEPDEPVEDVGRLRHDGDADSGECDVGEDGIRDRAMPGGGTACTNGSQPMTYAALCRTPSRTHQVSGLHHDQQQRHVAVRELRELVPEVAPRSEGNHERDEACRHC